MSVKAYSKRNITAVKIKDNQTFTLLKTAIKMTKQGKMDAVVVKLQNAKEHLRTSPDSKKTNSLDNMAGDK